MPRVQVYLPDDLYEQLKARRLPASELLQGVVAAEVRRQDLLAATDRYVDELIAEVGAPSNREIARAQAIARRLADRASANRELSRCSSSTEAVSAASRAGTSGPRH